MASDGQPFLRVTHSNGVPVRVSMSGFPYRIPLLVAMIATLSDKRWLPGVDGSLIEALVRAGSDSEFRSILHGKGFYSSTKGIVSLGCIPDLAVHVLELFVGAGSRGSAQMAVFELGGATSDEERCSVGLRLLYAANADVPHELFEAARSRRAFVSAPETYDPTRLNAVETAVAKRKTLAPLALAPPPSGDSPRPSA